MLVPDYPGGPVLHQTHGSAGPRGVVMSEVIGVAEEAEARLVSGDEAVEEEFSGVALLCEELLLFVVVVVVADAVAVAVTDAEL